MRRTGRGWGRAAIATGIVAAVLAAAGAVFWFTKDDTDMVLPPTLFTSPSAPNLASQTTVFERLSGPDRTVLRDGTGAVVAVFTDGARTVTINGAKRTFQEAEATSSVVNTATWVRLAPQPWRAGEEKAAWFETWLRQARQDTSPDVLAIAFEYVIGAPAANNAEGVRFRGDASFGPIKASGAGRQEQSDFYDYLGVPWSFPDG
ncbi:MAG: hypothetical protein M3443_13380, partial [Actinomycetota bacterium]|nr:hypothetical protein [Actinomycetota bacterium]